MTVAEDATRTATTEAPMLLPILPITDAVLFPNMLMPLIIKNETWIKLIDDAALANKMLAVFWRPEVIEPFDPQTISPIGATAQIVRMMRLQDGRMQVLLQGQSRASIQEFVATEPYPTAMVLPVEDEVDANSLEVEALSRNTLAAFQSVIQISATLPDELAVAAANAPTSGTLADMVAVNLNLKPDQQQAVRDAIKVEERLRIVMGFLEREREILEIGQKAQVEMSKTQREYILRQQLEAIRRELGETDDRDAELAELRRKIDETNLPEEPRREAERELKRLERLPPGAADASVIRTYLDVLLDLPWSTSTPDNFDIQAARAVLDSDHYALDKIKDRIIEYLAVRKLQHEQGADRLRGPILCFVGPPGVGKTSLGQSIARALGRKFVRVALGGVRDESDIRGFRRTYVGALPGRMMQGISRAGSNNPVLMLDEIDKLTMGLQGDPSAALLELLDPEQNKAFVDRYLDVPFDLSRVLFIATANRIDTIPPALLDRMELLELSGYTEAEKLQISRRYLIPRQQQEQGMGEYSLHIPDDTLQRLIRDYTREAGVRNLERQVGAIFRKMATRVAARQPVPERIQPEDLDDLLGVGRFRTETLLGEDEVGVATGLAWTPVGGDVLFIETSVIPGNGQLILTGQLGDVMRESARAALTYARSRSSELGLDEHFTQKHDIHIHVPAGAVPKDGPSAGITMASSLVSALTGRQAHKHVAMTGEITLRGRVLPIGGVKEKVLAAQRMGVQKVLLPSDNAPDLRDVPAEIREQLDVVLVSHMDEVLPHVLAAGG
ncbi:MAG: endopeptidase La [Chloroflexaceae bacterium]|nr:endopeptidase La [Chloroflexaceae bacterium]